MSSHTLNLTLKVWRQKKADSPGQFEIYEARDIDQDSSFLEMLDVVNEDLTRRGIEPIAFDHDCREGICGMCGAVVNGKPHGPLSETTLCQLHMRHFKNGDVITIEPWRVRAMPVVKDLVVDRSAFDRIIEKGGYISVKTGNSPSANAIPVKKTAADLAMDAAACIGCGACAAACPNASAMLFVGAKVSQLSRLPQGDPERARRVRAMINQMDAEGFGNCSNEYECVKACPKGIQAVHMAKLNREYLRAQFVE